jgi:hypothetical protein
MAAGQGGVAVLPDPPVAGKKPKSQAQKNPPKRVFSSSGQRRLDNLNFLSLHTFLAFGSHEGNLLAFFQALEAVALDGAEVYEEVFARLRGDEAEAFFIVEPLDGTGLAIGHVNVSLNEFRFWGTG